MKPEVQECPRCAKRPALCVCSEIQPQKTRLQVLILQHPQEPDQELGSARLSELTLPQSKLVVGLSWRNLAQVLGRPAEPKRWAVLYLGSGVKGKPTGPITLTDKAGKPLPDSEECIRGLEGIIALDGTWSQAKTLWWRNAWLLKCRRAILTPTAPSQYRELRREPRRECVSTAESLAEALEGLGDSASASAELRRVFGLLLNRKRSERKNRGSAPAAVNGPSGRSSAEGS